MRLIRMVLVGAALLSACSREDPADGGDLAAGPFIDLGNGLGNDDFADAGPSCLARGGVPGDTNVMIHVASGDRRYLLHIPPQYVASAPMPLYVVVHGLTDDPEKMRDLSHFNTVADERGFLVAYPAGITDAWNGGTCCAVPVATNIDDVGFIRAVLDQIESQLCVDERRVFATGFSNGGFMVHRLGCEMSDRFAAIAVASGEEAIPTCAPVRPVPVVQLHGTADPLVPYDGNPLLGFPSTMATMTGWAMRDGCATTTTPLGVIGSVTCVGWNGCADHSDVVLCTNQGGVHEWVGGGSAWTSAGPPPGFVTTLYFADFLAAHPMP